MGERQMTFMCAVRENTMNGRKAFSTILISVLILAGYYLLFGARTSKVVSLNFTETEMNVSGPEGFVWECSLSDIEQITFTDHLDAGTCVNGSETKNYRIGRWRSDAYGDYQICGSTAIASYVVVTTRSQGIFLFNYETAANTEALYDSFVKMIEQL